MAEREHAVTLRRVFDAPRDLVWALVADTNRWDRASGMTAGRYEWRNHDGRWLRMGKARELGQDIEWFEPPYQWVESWFLEGERVFTKGPVARGGFRARLRDVEGGTEVEATGFTAGEGTVAALIGAIMKSRFRRALGHYFDGIAEVVSRATGTADRSAPAVQRIRQALASGYDPITSGARTPSNLDALERRAAVLRQQGVADAMADRLVELLRDRPDEELAQIRPFELAALWEADRRETLRAFLYATVAGLVDLRWQINCPVCRVAAGVVGALDEVRPDVHCEACNIDYGVDFGTQVEAVFQCNAAVRHVEPKVYCASSPAFLPHVYAQLSLDGRSTREESADLPRGEVRVRTSDGDRAVNLEVPEPGSILEVVVHVDQLEASVKPSTGSAGLVRVVNRTGRPVTLLVERSGWAADAVLGSVIASFPDFLGLFATEAPASGVDLSIGHLALLFSDLTGSTALYERIGDARAFAVVEEHFRLMDEVVRRHGGAIVKTMGDAVMASFSSPERAVEAALQMVVASDDAHAGLGLGVKLGVHAGACLAVRANDRLDFFGTTVNVAARLQAQAEGGHIVLTEELSRSPGVAAVIAGHPQRSFHAALKGIRDEQLLVSIDAREGAQAASSRAS